MTFVKDNPIKNELTKQDRFEKARCKFEVGANKCQLIGTMSSAPGSRLYCPWHYLQVLPKPNKEFTQEEFIEFVESFRKIESANIYFKENPGADTKEYMETQYDYNINQLYQGNNLLWEKVLGGSRGFDNFPNG